VITTCLKIINSLRVRIAEGTVNSNDGVVSRGVDWKELAKGAEDCCNDDRAIDKTNGAVVLSGTLTLSVSVKYVSVKHIETQQSRNLIIYNLDIYIYI
jgi:hypothetical protein